MKLISIIGTRPQYIKVKPIYDYCLENHIDHIILDTNQHYSDEVSNNIIKDLNLKIDLNLNATGKTEIEFISNCILLLENFLKQQDKEKVVVMVYGDTNSSFATSLVCYKLKIKLSHIEAGIRSGNVKIPEELNRIFSDFSSDLNFCTRENDVKNINNGIFCGDLEYELLNKMNFDETKENKFGLMTIHRQDNIDSNRIKKIFEFCENLGPIILPIHHRLKNQSWFDINEVPKNIKIIEPLIYSEMVEVLNSCKFILTDSGGILKTTPFFGKKTLILRPECGWIDVIEKGLAKVCEFNQEDVEWVLNNDVKKNKDFYLSQDKPSKIIVENIIEKFKMR